MSVMSGRLDDDLRHDNAPWQTVIVGAGAAGLGAATLFAASDSGRTLLVEAHSEPGGCAGYFARGFPRRVHDAGATQLVEFRPGGLQYELLKLALGGDDAQKPIPEAHAIRFLDHVWPRRQGEDSGGDVLRWSAEGSLRNPWDLGGDAFDQRACDNLSRFMSQCARDAAILWTLFYEFPDFPVHGGRDLARLIMCLPRLDWRDAVRVGSVLGKSVYDVARSFGVTGHARSMDLIDALLLDTSQNNSVGTPYPIGALGLSIVQRGIVRLDGGMASLFRNWLRGIRGRGVRTMTQCRVTEITSLRGGGFALQLVDAKNPYKVSVVTARDVVLALPLRAALDLLPADDVLRSSRTCQRWLGVVRSQREWQAFALHGVLWGASQGAPADEEPWYLQIFPAKGDPLRHALYVSCERTAVDARTGKKFRTFTASVHADLADELLEQGRAASTGDSGQAHAWQLLCDGVKGAMKERIRLATGLEMGSAELATPLTYARYTGRPEGRVGGFVATQDNVLFRAPPKIIEGVGGGHIVMAGDGVFPGQGVIAASMSGVLAWSRLTGRRPQEFLDLNPRGPGPSTRS